jgi:transcriptional regulator with XRE-family HTH domain
VRSRFTFGRNVARLRSQRGLTQEKLAEKADLDRSFVQRIEKGESSPTVEKLGRLRKALACSWEELLRGID